MYIVLRGKIPVGACRTVKRARELCAQLAERTGLEYYAVEVVSMKPIKRT